MSQGGIPKVGRDKVRSTSVFSPPFLSFRKALLSTPFFSLLLLQHTFPSVGFTLQNVGGGENKIKRVGAGESAQVCRRTGTSRKSPNGVWGGSRDGETKTHGTPIAHTHEST